MIRILLAEDDYMTRLYLQKFLSRYGDCDVVVNGQEAIDAYNISIFDKFHYDLICLDIMMPSVSGYQVLKYIRNCEKEKQLENVAVIVMVTALNQKKNVDDALELGADKYYCKPIDEEDFEKFLKSKNLI